LIFCPRTPYSVTDAHLLPAHDAGLEEDSVVNVTQVVTVDRDFLESRIGALPDELLQRVEDGLRLIQGL
jgi:mRNA interferase MazF